MKQVLGCMKKADIDFAMIEDGDRIAVGLSGGKDSTLLLHALSLYRQFSRKKYTLHAFTVTLGLRPFDTTPLAKLCEELKVAYTVRETDIAEILFTQRKEKNPCSLCAKMRRGILMNLANEFHCNKLALGHHGDDGVETLLMSLLYENRLHTFHPVTYLSRADVTAIRPMVYMEEKHIQKVVRRLNLPVVKNPCPVDGHTKRQEIKELLTTLSKSYPHIRESLLQALRKDHQYGLWNKPTQKEKPEKS
ncbi:MAG: tRNA 2-thiocytidine biosynthesis protein TtcA [Clostridiales bacterium]|nr:tRNA 2-thiocytidine biosynthesis protein TtcA [Clostridiales bacterium]